MSCDLQIFMTEYGLENERHYGVSEYRSRATAIRLNLDK